MKLIRFLNNLFPKEFRNELFGSFLLVGGVISFITFVMYILGLVASYFNWFPNDPSILNKGSKVFLSILLSFVLCGYVVLFSWSMKKLIKYLIKTWKES